ncbi:MAG: phosphoglucosamine mutase [Alphaproteobacteria bacterium]
MVKRKYFGTDGMRGAANKGHIVPQTVLRLAMAAGAHFQRGDHKNRVVIGKDTRLSGYMLENALTAGFLSMGMDVLLLGPVPTPAVAMLTKSMRAELGVMISASHNPFFDNGIKLFGPDGYKLSDNDEQIITNLMDQQNWILPDSQHIGRAKRIDDAAGRYIEFVKGAFPSNLSLDGLKLVIDCAHGAAYQIAPIVLKELGAQIIPIGVEPNGKNINDRVGATHPQAMADMVKQQGADMGIALDGDADRLIVCDELGQIIDGDQILALIATLWHEMGRLQGPVIATILSNMGLEQYLNSFKVDLVRSQVGDRYVVDQMKQHEAVLGGEASGHIVLGHHATTGDGLMAALQVLACMIQRKQKMSALAKTFTPVPQLVRNLSLADHHKIIERPAVKQAIDKCHDQLGDSGRLIIRPSGTEPLIRMMIEGKDTAHHTKLLDQLEASIRASAA